MEEVNNMSFVLNEIGVLQYSVYLLANLVISGKSSKNIIDIIDLKVKYQK